MIYDIYNIIYLYIKKKKYIYILYFYKHTYIPTNSLRFRVALRDSEDAAKAGGASERLLDFMIMIMMIFDTWFTRRLVSFFDFSMSFET